MKSHKWIAGGLTFLVSAALATSSFAAKALSDKEMDQATAKGQSAVSIGTGDQTIKDKSEATLSFKNTKGTDQTIHNLDDFQKVEGGVVYPQGTSPGCQNCGQQTGGEVVNNVGPQTQALDKKQKTEKDDLLLNVNAVQEHAIAGNLINVVGENNIAALVNAASSGGGALDTIKQENNIDQSKAAYIDKSQLDIKEFSLSHSEKIDKTENKDVVKNTTYHKVETEVCVETFALDKSKSSNKTKNETWTETFPVATINIDINSDATSTGNGNATSTGDASATGNSTATSTASNTKTDTDTETETKNINVNVNKNINIDKTIPAQAGLAGFSGGSEGGNEGGNGRSHSSSGGVSVDVDKDETITVSRNTTTTVNAKGVAAVADSNADSHEQAYGSAAATGTAKAESDASAKLDLPTAESGTYNSTYAHSSTFSIDKSKSKNKSETTDKTDNSTYKSDETFSKVEKKSITYTQDESQLDIVQADHVKIGDGEQNICLETEYDITMEGNAQGSARALNIINVSGRNNVAVAWNLASSAGGALDVSPFVSSGTPTTPGSIHQLNVVKQVN